LAICVAAVVMVLGVLLWLPDYGVMTPVGAALIEMCQGFLSTSRVRDAYGSYPRSHARRLAKRAASGKEGLDASGSHRTAKHARHCYRLLLAGTQLLTTGELMVNVAHHRDEIEAAGQLALTDPARFVELFAQRSGQLDRAVSVLPEHSDCARANALVVAARLGNLDVG
jgi:hypothetical protein